MTSIICRNRRCRELVSVIDRRVSAHLIPGSTEECPESGSYYKPQKVGSKYDEGMGSPIKSIDFGVAECKQHGRVFPALRVEFDHEWMAGQMAETDPSKVN